MIEEYTSDGDTVKCIQKIFEKNDTNSKALKRVSVFKLSNLINVCFSVIMNNVVLSINKSTKSVECLM